MYGLINSTVNSKNECIDILVYDIEKAFDSLWLENCLNELYDSLSVKNRNEKFHLVGMMNNKNLVAIRTPFGTTERTNIPDIIQQGGIFGPLTCSNVTYSLGRKCQEIKAHLFK